MKTLAATIALAACSSSSAPQVITGRVWTAVSLSLR